MGRGMEERRSGAAAGSGCQCFGVFLRVGAAHGGNWDSTLEERHVSVFRQSMAWNMVPASLVCAEYAEQAKANGIRRLENPEDIT